MKTIFISIIIVFCFFSCNVSEKKEHKEKPESLTIYNLNSMGTGNTISIEVKTGQSHNHPLIAMWIEDENGTYIQTIYVAQSIAKGYFAHGDASSGKWKPGAIRRPAALPHWAFQRGVIESDSLYIPTIATPIVDAYTGATPPSNFKINSKLDNLHTGKLILKLEVNQSWDWNEFWTNNKYPGDANYATSAQPAIVYAATIDVNNKNGIYFLKPIGHSHYSGKNGSVSNDLSTLTTALNILSEIKVTVE